MWLFNFPMEGEARAAFKARTYLPSSSRARQDGKLTS